MQGMASLRVTVYRAVWNWAKSRVERCRTCCNFSGSLESRHSSSDAGGPRAPWIPWHGTFTESDFSWERNSQLRSLVSLIIAPQTLSSQTTCFDRQRDCKENVLCKKHKPKEGNCLLQNKLALNVLSLKTNWSEKLTQQKPKARAKLRISVSTPMSFVVWEPYECSESLPFCAWNESPKLQIDFFLQMFIFDFANNCFSFLYFVLIFTKVFLFSLLPSLRKVSTRIGGSATRCWWSWSRRVVCWVALWR